MADDLDGRNENVNSDSQLSCRDPGIDVYQESSRSQRAIWSEVWLKVMIRYNLKCQKLAPCLEVRVTLAIYISHA